MHLLHPPTMKVRPWCFLWQQPMSTFCTCVTASSYASPAAQRLVPMDDACILYYVGGKSSGGDERVSTDVLYSFTTGQLKNHLHLIVLPKVRKQYLTPVWFRRIGIRKREQPSMSQLRRCARKGEKKNDNKHFGNERLKNENDV